MKKRLLLFVIFPSVTAIAFLQFGNDVLLWFENNSTSQIIRVDGKDRVQSAKRLKAGGVNFETYSRTLSTLGRTHVHSTLRNVILEAYQKLEVTTPHIRWIYGETGWKNGESFWPHRTHLNGLSADFLVPVFDRQSLEPRQLYLWPFNAWGYWTRFDANGIHGSYEIDFASMIKHLRALQDTCEVHGLKIKRVIFDPPLVERLKREATFTLISQIAFMKGPAWFPHDSHYHVDFEII